MIAQSEPEKHVIRASAIIPARQERVYSLIAKYRDGHPRILLKQFSNLSVEQGGVGAGTVIRFQMSVFGKKQTFRAAVTEPEPGPRAGGDGPRRKRRSYDFHGKSGTCTR